jgi:hypothetical protein
MAEFVEACEMYTVKAEGVYSAEWRMITHDVRHFSCSIIHSLCNIMGGGEYIPAMGEVSDPGQNVYRHAVVDLGR